MIYVHIKTRQEKTGSSSEGTIRNVRHYDPFFDLFGADYKLMAS